MSRLTTLTIRDERMPELNRVQRAMIAVRDAWTALRSYTLPPLTIRDPEVMRRLHMSDYLGSGDAGYVPSDHESIRLSSVFQAGRLISEQLASLPLILYLLLSDGGRERAVKHPAYRLLRQQPNSEMGAMRLREAATMQALFFGNAYIEIERRGDGRPYALWLLVPWAVMPFRTDAGDLWYSVAGNTTPVNIPARDVIHLAGPSPDGLLGYNIIDLARRSIGVGLGAERFGSAFFSSGMAVSGTLTHPATLGETARKNLQESLNHQHQGLSRAHRLLLLEENMKFEKFSIDPEQGQFNETRVFQISEVARWFSISPIKLRDLSRSTYSNSEQENLSFVTETLRPWAIRWEQELANKLLLPGEQDNYYVEHLFEALLRGDTAARGEYYAKLFDRGVMSIDEIRQRENLNPIGTERGGDVHWVAVNYAPSDHRPEVAAPAQDQPARAHIGIDIETPESRAERAREARAQENRDRMEAQRRRLAMEEKQARVMKEIANFNASEKAKADAAQRRRAFERKYLAKYLRKQRERDLLIA